LVVGYLSVFKIYPIFEDHVPWVIALIVTYALGAYILIPGIMRLIRMWHKPKHMPLYCVTADGFASDPLNISLRGTRDQVMQAMTAAGWSGADKLTIRTAARTILHTLYGWQYDTPPMSPLFLFGRKQDLAFQIPIEGRIGSRHHVRFWQTLENGKIVWLGAASRDVGVTFIRHNAQLTHLVHPNTDDERDLIVRQLTTANMAKLVKHAKLTEPYKLINVHALRGHLHTDGRMAVLKL